MFLSRSSSPSRFKRLAVLDIERIVEKTLGKPQGKLFPFAKKRGKSGWEIFHFDLERFFLLSTVLDANYSQRKLSKEV